MKYNEFGELVDDTPTTRQRSQPAVAPQAPVPAYPAPGDQFQGLGPTQLPRGRVNAPNALPSNHPWHAMNPQEQAAEQARAATLKDPVIDYRTGKAVGRLDAYGNPDTRWQELHDHTIVNGQVQYTPKEGVVQMQQNQMGPQLPPTPFHEMPSMPATSEMAKNMKSNAGPQFNVNYVAAAQKLNASRNFQEYEAGFEDLMKQTPGSEYIRDEVRQNYFSKYMPEGVRREHGQQQEQKQIDKAFELAGLNPKDPTVKEDNIAQIDPNGKVVIQKSPAWIAKQEAIKEEAKDIAIRKHEEHMLTMTHNHEIFMKQQEDTKAQAAETKEQAKQDRENQQYNAFGNAKWRGLDLGSKKAAIAEMKDINTEINKLNEKIDSLDSTDDAKKIEAFTATKTRKEAELEKLKNGFGYGQQDATTTPEKDARAQAILAANPEHPAAKLVAAVAKAQEATPTTMPTGDPTGYAGELQQKYTKTTLAKITPEAEQNQFFAKHPDLKQKFETQSFQAAANGLQQSLGINIYRRNIDITREELINAISQYASRADAETLIDKAISQQKAEQLIELKRAEAEGPDLASAAFDKTTGAIASLFAGDPNDTPEAKIAEALGKSGHTLRATRRAQQNQ